MKCVQIDEGAYTEEREDSLKHVAQTVVVPFQVIADGLIRLTKQKMSLIHINSPHQTY